MNNQEVYSQNKFIIQRAFERIRQSPNGSKILPIVLATILLAPTVPAELAYRIGKGLTEIIRKKEHKNK